MEHHECLRFITTRTATLQAYVRPVVQEYDTKHYLQRPWGIPDQYDDDEIHCTRASHYTRLGNISTASKLGPEGQNTLWGSMPLSPYKKLPKRYEVGDGKSWSYSARPSHHTKLRYDITIWLTKLLTWWEEHCQFTMPRLILFFVQDYVSIIRDGC